MDQIKKRFFLPEKFELALNCKNVKEPPVRYLVSAEHSVVRNETLFLVLRHIIIWIAKSVRYHFCSSDDRGFFFLIGFFFFFLCFFAFKSWFSWTCLEVSTLCFYVLVFMLRICSKKLKDTSCTW